MECKGMLPTSSERVWIGTQPIYPADQQKARLLTLLLSRPFVTLPEIMNLRIADYHRVMDFLKDDGYLIQCIHNRSNSVYILHGFDENQKRKNRSWYAKIWSKLTSSFSPHA